MSETQYTPGDWYCPKCLCYLSPQRVTNDERCDTCFSQVYWDDGVTPRCTYEAAPDLLEACEEILRVYDEWGQDGTSGVLPVSIKPQLDQARAAIAKATGT